jgi:serine/threonine protein phosphatase PrpC
MVNYSGFFCVCDGHGGTACSDFVSDRIAHYVFKHPAFNSDVVSALHESFAALEREWCELSRVHDTDGGTTVIVALLHDNHLIVSNIGDSEGVLCRAGRAVSLSVPHTLRNPGERERLVSCGARIYRDRVGHPKYNPAYFSIAVTRAIGDVLYKDDEFTGGSPSGLVAVPDTQVIALSDEDQFLILACDGLWDVMTHQDACDYALRLIKIGKERFTRTFAVPTDSIGTREPADVLPQEQKAPATGLASESEGVGALPLSRFSSLTVSAAEADAEADADADEAASAARPSGRRAVAAAASSATGAAGTAAEQSSEIDWSWLAEQLALRAIRLGSTDNITVLIVNLDSQSGQNAYNLKSRRGQPLTCLSPIHSPTMASVRLRLAGADAAETDAVAAGGAATASAPAATAAAPPTGMVASVATALSAVASGAAAAPPAAPTVVIPAGDGSESHSGPDSSTAAQAGGSVAARSPSLASLAATTTLSRVGSGGAFFAGPGAGGPSVSVRSNYHGVVAPSVRLHAGTTMNGGAVIAGAPVTVGGTAGRQLGDACASNAPSIDMRASAAALGRTKSSLMSLFNQTDD